MDLYTWDYTALLAMPSPKAPQALVDLGFVIRVEKDPPKPTYPSYFDKKKLVSYEITAKGRTWIASVEDAWERQCEGTRWWSVSGTPGVFVIALYDGMHPSEAFSDLRRYFGVGFQFSPPHHDDECEGRPYRYGEEWRPWKAWAPFLDLREEDPSRHVMKGAFLRIFGAPLDPELAFYEACGTEPSAEILDLARAVAHLGKVSLPPKEP